MSDEDDDKDEGGLGDDKARAHAGDSANDGDDRPEPPGTRKGRDGVGKRAAPPSADQPADKPAGATGPTKKKGPSSKEPPASTLDAPRPTATRWVRLKVRRQDGADKPDTKRWEEFKVPYLPQMNVHSALEQIRLDPRTIDGTTVAPPVWEAACLEEVCGSCTMLINGKVRQACSALINELSPNGESITLEPMSKFPNVRDLVVDRAAMFEHLKKVRAWIDLDGTHELGPGPRESPENQAERYPLSRCMTCGCCVEACPQFNDSSPFIGPAAINQVRLFNMHPSGALHKNARLETMMGEGGVADCGKAQNCVEVCPKEIPLVDSIAVVARDTTKRMLFGWLLK
jgi:succinate dehydrogenase / fumarate reductase iron-sulfur subunit